MCGVAGIVNSSGHSLQETKGLIQKMISRLSHRGPDGEGIVCTDFAAFGHRRLSILDLSANGHQPMWDGQKKYVITYNGEIYNFLEIKKELSQKGHIFKTGTDTEVILNAFIEWGPGCLEKLNGIFAFAIWSEDKKELFLARDPIGIKPLFFSQKDSRFLFASEIKSLLADSNVSTDQDEHSLDNYFTFNYSVAPQTGFKDIQQVMPGQYLLLKNNKLEKHEYSYRAKENHEIANWRDEREVTELFRDQFRSTLKRQLIADVPVGAFLSGGIDSSAICAFLAEQGVSPKCFHMSFQQESFDESPFAQLLSQHLKLPLTQFSANVNEDDLVEISKHLEEPTADASSLAMFQLCKKTSEHVKVVLSGDGADEILAGYNTYSATQLARLFKNPISKFLLRGTRHFLPLKASDSRYSKSDFYDRFTRFASEPFPFDHAGWRSIFYKEHKTSLYKKSFLNAVKNHDPYERYSAAGTGPGNLVELSMQMDTKFYLPNDMLVKVDRMSMASGLEVRVPFLDLEFLHFCQKLPTRWKLRNFTNKKYILKKSLQGRIPHQILSKPKTGFNFPIAENLKFKWCDLFEDLMQDQHIKSSSVLDIEEVRKFYSHFKKYNTNSHYQLFGVLMYLLWVRNIKEWSQ